MADGPWTKYASSSPQTPSVGSSDVTGPWQQYQQNPMSSAAPTAMAVSSNVAIPPAGLVPGSKDYAQWAIQQVKAGKTLPQVSKPLPAVQGTQANMTGPLDQISTGFTGAVSNLPIVGPGFLSGLEGLKAGIWKVPKAQISAEDDARAAQNPVANDIGSVAGATLPFIAAGGVPIVGAALGMDSSVPLALQMGLGAASNRAIYAADAAARGQNPSQTGSVAGVVGALSPLLGRGVGAIGQKVADSMTQGAQRAATDAAIRGVDASSASLKAAGGDLFDAAFPDGSIPAVSPQAYARLWNNIAEATARYRPNAANDPQAVGLLQHFAGLGQDVNTPGTIVDLKDLHMARQLAQQIGQMPGRQGAIGNIVTTQLDNFMKGLQPSDILGGTQFVPMDAGDKMGLEWSWNRSPQAGMAAAKFGDNVYVGKTHADALQQAIAAEGDSVRTAVNTNPEQHLGYQVPTNLDPRQKVSDLFQGISTWNRAIKVGTIEDAIQSGANAKSGPENGLKNAFAAITRTPDFTTRYTPAEQQAIQQVAKGTPLQNFASLFGNLGVNFGAGPKHIIGGGGGTIALTGGLTPFLGPFAFPAAAAATTGAGYLGRGVAENIANKSAQRAVNVLATPNIPQVAPMPNMLPPDLFSLLSRFAGGGLLSGQTANAPAGVPSQ